jgi:RNA polymerase sigma factor (sigma-70 family)
VWNDSVIHRSNPKEAQLPDDRGAHEAAGSRPADTEVLRDLFVHNYQRYLAFALVLCGREEAAAEIVHDAYVSLFSRPRKLRDPVAGNAYIRRSIMNAARMRIRRTRERIRHESDEGGVDAIEKSAGRGDREVEREALLPHVKRLPRRQREVIAMRFFLDMSEQQMALELGISPGAVKTHMSRALKTLGVELGGNSDISG